MKPRDKKLILTILRFLPRLAFTVLVQGLGGILLLFALSFLFPEHPFVWNSLTLPYLCWSFWRVGKQINRWSETAVKTMP